MSQVNMWEIEQHYLENGYQLICGKREKFSEAEIIKDFCKAYEKI